MKKILIALGILMALAPVLVSCSSAGDFSSVDEADLIELFNGESGRVYLGVSGRYTDDGKAKAAAVRNCAINIALNESLFVKASYSVEEITKLGYRRFKTEAMGVYDDESLERIEDGMEIIELRRGDYDTGFFCLATYNGSEHRGRDFHERKGKGGRPSWIDDPPEWKGTVTEVGSTKEWYFLQDSLEAAAFDGAVKLAERLGGQLNAVAETIVGRNEHMHHESTQFLFNEVRDFTVLRYWYDAGERVWYSLVTAKEVR